MALSTVITLVHEGQSIPLSETTPGYNVPSPFVLGARGSTYYTVVKGEGHKSRSVSA